MRLQSREDQDLSAAATAGQLILKMNSEHQTVDHRNKFMGNDHGTIFVQFAQHPEQEDTNFVNSAQNANGFSQSSD